MSLPEYATLQKIHGTKRVFAITPRIPGGFISPDRLIKIAEVTKKYNCSLKLTSGQRILIIGLKAEDVPKCYEDLGMEPAVKSAYSVKNVEMCPGEICKRSRQPSLRLGMRLEERYYGAPAPNRMKIGVAGCMNACGSVHSKDIGVTANESGYRVGIGGSAGFTPRLPDIIAENLTEDEAYNLVEAVYEFYCETAQKGEKLGNYIDRITLESFKEGVDKIFEKKQQEAENE